MGRLAELGRGVWKGLGVLVMALGFAYAPSDLWGLIPTGYGVHVVVAIGFALTIWANFKPHWIRDRQIVRGIRSEHISIPPNRDLHAWVGAVGQCFIDWTSIDDLRTVQFDSGMARDRGPGPARELVKRLEAHGLLESAQRPHATGAFYSGSGLPVLDTFYKWNKRGARVYQRVREEQP